MIIFGARWVDQCFPRSGSWQDIAFSLSLNCNLLPLPRHRQRMSCNLGFTIDRRCVSIKSINPLINGACRVCAGRSSACSALPPAPSARRSRQVGRDARFSHVRNTSAATPSSKSSGLTTPDANFAEEAQCSGAISLLLLRFADDETDSSHQDVFENRMAMAKL
jgi:hypothetical protein